MTTRRQVLQCLPLVALAVSVALPGGNTALAHVHGRGVASGAPAPGVFPNADAAFLPMRQVYPAPTGVQSYEGHQIAYYKPSGGDTCQYRTRIGVSFGRWPYIYQLVSGPSWLSFGATIWNAAWDGKGDLAFQNGYGVLQGTPTGAISSGSPITVSVNVIDQDSNVKNVTFPIWTSDDIANGGVVAFLNADTGNDSTGNGSKATPWQTLGKVCGINGGAGSGIGTKCYMRGATAQYWLPPTANLGASTNVKPTTTPATFIGYPGELPTLDFTGSQDSGAAAWTVIIQGGGITFQDFALNGYNTAQANIKMFDFSSNNRLSFIGIIASNTGYGTGFTNNSALFYGIGGSPSFGTYLFITGCEENGRQSSLGANNACPHEIYSYQEVLVETNAVSGTLLGNTFFFKSDIGYGCLRANQLLCTEAVTAFSCYQAPYQGTQNNQSCYNVATNINNVGIPWGNGYSYGTILMNRNNFTSTNGVVCNSPTINLEAPYTHANVISGAPNGLTIAAPSVNSSGGTLGAGPWYYGMTSVGVTGETTIFTAIGTSEVEITGLSGSTNAVTLSFLPDPYASSQNIYRGTASGTYTEVANIPTGVSAVTDIGSGITWSGGSASWTSTASSPGSNTAVSAQRFIANNNVVQTSVALPSGATLTTAGNQLAATGLLNTSTGLLLISNGGKYGAELT